MGGALSYVDAVFTANWVTTGWIVAFLVIGVVFIRIGLRELKSVAVAAASPGTYQPPEGSAGAVWRVFPPGGSEEVNRQLLRQRNQILGCMQIGLGVGTILAACLTAGLSLALYSSLGHDFGAQLASELYPVVMLIGATVGYAPGILSVRRNRQSVQQFTGVGRSLSDYCSPWIWIAPVAIAGLSAFLLFDASLGARPVEIHWFGAPLSTTGPIMGGLVTSVFVLAVGFPALMGILVARAPNTLTSLDLQASQRANDDLRAGVSSMFVFLTWMIAAFPGQNALSLRSALRIPTHNNAIDTLVTIATLLQVAAVVGLMPMVVMSATGRMGGRLTGWLWRRRSSRHELPAIEE